MYGFSRSLYRTLAPAIVARRGEDSLSCRRGLLTSCEDSIERLAYDAEYFRHPVKTLFCEVRDRFRFCDQEWARAVIEEHVRVAGEAFEAERIGAAEPELCAGKNRFGESCQRPAKPGCAYCPSHRHLEAA